MKNIYRDDNRKIEAFLLPDDCDGKGSVIIIKSPTHEDEKYPEGIDIHAINIDIETLSLICNKAKVTMSLMKPKKEEPKIYQDKKPLKEPEFTPRYVLK